MSTVTAHPQIIQGGMGVGVSNWVLAKAVSMQEQLGVVSASVLDTLFVRRLQDGDPGGHIRRALEHFPIPDVAQRLVDTYFKPEGREEAEPYKLLSMYKTAMSKAREQVTVAANFCEVWLAREGHTGKVGINLLTKVQMPNLASLYGAMLAGVDYVLMGAGIPKDIPGVLDRFKDHLTATLRIDVLGEQKGESTHMELDPVKLWDGKSPDVDLKRPYFLPIIASNSLATMLKRKANGRVDGFIIEAPVAGGHNAPPRGALQIDENGEPIYGERDVVNLAQMREEGLPFWLAGGTGTPEQFREALSEGAAGIQVGTLFAYCNESGLREVHKAMVLNQESDAPPFYVKTDLRASPTGFPFKVVELPGTLAIEEEYKKRDRICDLGYLRTAYRTERGVGYRCPAEPVADYLRKGGPQEDTDGRKCLCNALLADIGHGQLRDNGVQENSLLTSGNDLATVKRCATQFGGPYSAADAVSYLLGN